MNQVMTPSEMTQEQINKAVANYRAMLVKHASNFSSEAVQQVLGSKELAGDQFGVFRAHVEAISNMIVRRVQVDRVRTPEEAISATGRTKYINNDALQSMPRGEGFEVEVSFIKFGKNLSPSELEQAVDTLGYRLADIYTIAAVNEIDPAFSDKHPNAMQSRDQSGSACYALFRRWLGERAVSVDRSAGKWRDSWWFACLRK